MIKGERTPVRELIRTCSTEIELPFGQIIHFPGTKDSSLYYIVSGSVRFIKNSFNGDEKILYVLGADNFFNEEILFGSHEIVSYLVCNENCVLWKIDSSLHGKLLENQEFVRAVCRGMTRKSDFLCHEVEQISFMSCKERILRTFAGECDKGCLYDSEWYSVSRQYTHQELASMIGANRVTVSRLISELCAENKLRSINRKIQIHRSAAERREEE